ncbi:hypothetical protein HID58_084401 [Brassica napus]|uniref:Fibronectin type III-like domain-containing protein n=1 Tax=Brassica napus TaxID=3708 RepID=A0ABQ7XMC5_BRANA|nr:hypothetical protein HID58_084401 [Brassica napus]
MCIGESLRPLFACDSANELTRTLRFCQVNIPVRVRVQDLIGRLTLQEKIRLLVNNAAAVPRLGIGGYEWWSEALHGVSDVGPGAKFGGAFPGATSFPQVITTASSFNQSLWEEIGRVVSDEARAMYNGGVAGLTYWSPNVNILRDPRWGRGQETPGEDPVVVGKYAASYVRGLQGNGPNRLKVAACCKHYTAYDLDNWNGVDRFHFNAKVTQQDLEDTYNVPFRACVYDGNVASVMCSYNQVNGKPTCADENLLKNTIRGQWQLNGYIVSDCDSVDVFFNQQHYTATPEEAAAASIKAGLDLDCGPFLAIFTEGAVKKGLLTENDINLALTNTITVQMRLGMFDGNLGPYANLGPRDVCTPIHQHLALEAAHQGIVLLKNDGRSLPLSPTRHRTVAVIGPNSDVTETMIGNYAGKACAYTTPLQGISKYARTLHQAGCSGVACAGNQGFGAAEMAAREADATVLVMGLDQSIEAETRDRTGLLLPGYQQDLVTRVAQASKGPVILVLLSGGPIDVSLAKNNPRVAAIIWAGYPGQAGGAAIADIIFGAVSPGGKLPMTWYPQDYVVKVPMTLMAMRASGDYPGRTYRFYKGPVVFPFGFGLSYTTFTHSLAQNPLAQLSVSPYKLNSAIFNSSSNSIKVSHANCETFPKMPIHVEVSNTGEFDGTHTVFVFAEAPRNGIKGLGVNKQLIAFEKVHVTAGAKRTVQVDVDACKHLGVVDEYGKRRIPMVLSPSLIVSSFTSRLLTAANFFSSPSSTSASSDTATLYTVSPRRIRVKNEFKKIELTSCDIFDGSWVFDDTKPVYSPGYCPFVEDKFNCFKNGRPDSGFLRYRWQPDGCSIPRFDGKKMLKILRGKRLVFVGDSLNRNMWESLVCSLRSALEDKNRVSKVSWRRSNLQNEGFYGFRFKDFGCSVDFIKSPFLVQESEVLDGYGKRKETLRLDVIQGSIKKIYKDADIIVFNTGHWWTHQKTYEGKDYYQEGNRVYEKLGVKEAYTKALHTWANWVDSNINMTKTRVFFVGYSSSHFRKGTWNAGGQCDGETRPIQNKTYTGGYPWMMKVVESVISDMKTPVFYMNITKMTWYRTDGHPSVYRQPVEVRGSSPATGMFQDCSHWCLPGVPDSWNQLLYATLLVSRGSLPYKSLGTLL